MHYTKRGGEGEGEETGRRGEGKRDTGSGEVERLLLSSSKSTVNNAGNYQGRQKKEGGVMGLWRGKEEGRKGGRVESKRGGG